MDGSVKKTVTINKTRRHAKSDDALTYKKPHKCTACKSSKTILLFEEDNSYIDPDGTGSKDSLREYLCLDCHQYMIIEIKGHYRKFYKRWSD